MGDQHGRDPTRLTRTVAQRRHLRAPTRTRPRIVSDRRRVGGTDRRRSDPLGRQRAPRPTHVLTPSSRSDEGELADAEVAGAKPGFAIGEVELPHPLEDAVEPVALDRRPVLDERVAPTLQGGRVVGAEIAAFGDRQRRVGLQRRVDRLDGGDEPAGEDVLVDPGVRVLCGEQPVVRDGDRLQADPAAGSEQPVEGCEVVAPEAPSDRLDHLDADDRVELACHLAVVGDEDADPSGHASGSDAPDGEVALLGRQRDRGDVRAALRRPDGELAPSGTDLEHLASGPH